MFAGVLRSARQKGIDCFERAAARRQCIWRRFFDILNASAGVTNLPAWSLARF